VFPMLQDLVRVLPGELKEVPCFTGTSFWTAIVEQLSITRGCLVRFAS